MTKYYAATDGKRTTFRATAERTYNSAGFDPIRFSANRPSGLMFPTIEITKAEYDALAGKKNARTKYNSPQHSWVTNDPDVLKLFRAGFAKPASAPLQALRRAVNRAIAEGQEPIINQSTE